MKTVQITFTAEIPVEATPDEVKAWVQYELNMTGGISGDNPLAYDELEGLFGSLDIEYI